MALPAKFPLASMASSIAQGMDVQGAWEDVAEMRDKRLCPATKFSSGQGVGLDLGTLFKHAQ